MTFIDALLLGLIQGLTEFLPVSSSGHLILMRDILGITSDYGLAVDATLHFATAFAVLLYFRKDIQRILQGLYRKIKGEVVDQSTTVLIYALIAGTIPAVLLGLLLENYIETAFRSAELVAWVFIIGSVLFILAEYTTKRLIHHGGLTVKNGFYIGLFQALALIPGMSRSGATISGGMLLGLRREDSARFAFLLSLPIILGAGGLKLLELSGAGFASTQIEVIAFAAIVAFLSGLACIHYLLKFLKNHTLYPFVVYRVTIAVIVLLYL